jgi:Fe-S cluster biogenesis protein NfuA
MFIQTEDTPNPETLKFMPGENVLNKGTVDFSNKEASKDSPLASRLFDVEGVSRVFLGLDFISVTKVSNLDWNTLKPSILTGIMEHYSSGLPILNDDEKNTSDLSGTEDTETIKQIKDLLETRVRPAVAMDGGDITFCSFEEGVVTLQMKGACAGCPSSTATLKMGIENMLRHYIPEVTEVKAAEL